MDTKWKRGAGCNSLGDGEGRWPNIFYVSKEATKCRPSKAWRGLEYSTTWIGDQQTMDR